MSGIFGVISKEECSNDIFYGTDYHSHLGTKCAGMGVCHEGNLRFRIHDISRHPFRSRFEDDLSRLTGNKGIGVISDFEPQPLIIGSHLGTYAIATIGIVKNKDELIKKAYSKGVHFSEMSDGVINQTELISTLVNEGSTFQEGIEIVQDSVKGSCSLVLLTKEGIYAARDKLGRTPIVIGKKDNSYAATSETCAFPTLEFEIDKYLGPGEIIFMTEDGHEQRKAPGDKMQICSFLWVYYGFPASHYEGINVESVRYKCGAALAKRDKGMEIDLVAGIPDSGTGHAIGYAEEKGVPYKRPFTKYTPTWPRSFMPTIQQIRNMVAKMKLIPIPELIKGFKISFKEDSIVRGTQLQDTIQSLHDLEAKEVHMRPACPPLTYSCEYLNFSRSTSPLELASRKAIKILDGKTELTKEELDEYSNPNSEKYCAMIEKIRDNLNLTSLKYQRLDDLIEAIGLPKEKLCTHCWDGSSYF